MKVKMILQKETRNFLVFGQTNDNGKTAMDTVTADILAVYLRKDTFNDLPEMITITVEAHDGQG